MALATQLHVSSFYTITFLYVDPAICLSTVYMSFFAPAFMLNAFISPNYPDKLGLYNPAQSFLFHMIGTAYLFFGWISAVLLWYTDPRAKADALETVNLRLGVWRIVEAGLLMIDIFLLGCQYDTLKTQNRLALDRLRVEDVGNVIILVFFGAVRSAFLARIGVKERDEQKKTQ